MLLGAIDGWKAGLALDQQVIRFLLAIRPAGPVAGDVAGDEARKPLNYCFRIEPNALCSTRG
jgi:hypothetical protein